MRGPSSIQRLLELAGVADRFVLVDDPEDVVPPLGVETLGDASG